MTTPQREKYDQRYGNRGTLGDEVLVESVCVRWGDSKASGWASGRAVCAEPRATRKWSRWAPTMMGEFSGWNEMRRAVK